MRSATLNWLLHALRRAGREDEARRALEPVQTEMDVIENDAYHRVLLLQRGLLDESAVLADATDAGTLYGVATWRLCNGDRAGAEELWRRIVEETPWNAFGHLGAEAELARSAE